MFFQQIIKAITNGWKWIILITLIAVVISLAISATTTPIYRTQATFIIAPIKIYPAAATLSALLPLWIRWIFSPPMPISSPVTGIRRSAKNSGYHRRTIGCLYAFHYHETGFAHPRTNRGRTRPASDDRTGKRDRHLRNSIHQCLFFCL